MLILELISSDQDYLIETEFQLNDSWGSPNNLEGTKRIPNTVQFRFKVDSTPPTSSLGYFIIINSFFIWRQGFNSFFRI